MANDRFEILTDRQRACLRLVKDGLTSKEIADQLGASPHAIDKSIKLAMAKLGTDRRMAAARLLVDHESQSGYQRLTPQSLDLPSISFPRNQGTSPGQGASPMVREKRADFGAYIEAASSPASSTSAKGRGGTDGATTSLLRVLDWVCRFAGIILMILAVAYASSLLLRHYEETHHIRPR